MLLHSAKKLFIFSQALTLGKEIFYFFIYSLPSALAPTLGKEIFYFFNIFVVECPGSVTQQSF